MIDQKCRLCPRECKAERENGQMGFCGMTGKGIRAARAALHFWEEPCISGERAVPVPSFLQAVPYVVFTVRTARSQPGGWERRSAFHAWWTSFLNSKNRER